MFCGKYIQQISILESELKDARAVQNALDRSTAIIELAIDGQFIAANDNFCSTMGYLLNDIVGCQHRMACALDFASGAEYANFWASLGRGEFLVGQFARVDRQGREIWLEASYNPVFGPDGKVQKIVKFVSEVTDQVPRHQAEKQSAATAYEVALETRGISQKGEAIHS